MKNARELWARLGLIDSMKSVKPVHQESQMVSEYQAMIDGYYMDIDNPKPPGLRNGAILMGVCRGRLSEGLDFKDRKARCVMIVGIPYPSLYEPAIILKRYFLDEKRDHQGRMYTTSDGK